MKTVHAVITGRVQGVNYRQACRQAARHLGLVGWVRNLVDGRVEFLCQGPPEAVDRLIDWAWAGPTAAQVTNVESEVVAGDPNLADFLIQPNSAKTGDDKGPR